LKGHDVYALHDRLHGLEELYEKEDCMKFYLAEGNLGGGVTREQVDTVIQKLKDRGWHVEYGTGNNKAEDISEFGREESLLDAFSDDFMVCLNELGI
jgi:hypothetical protein